MRVYALVYSWNWNILFVARAATRLMQEGFHCRLNIEARHQKGRLRVV